MARFVPTLILTVLLSATSSALAQGSVDSVTVLVADDPAQCLSLEGLFLDGDNYILIDGRSNTGRVKFMSADGNVFRTAVSTVPLPNAASLPCDILPSPFGLDRVVSAGDALWAVPAPWAGTAAEIFDMGTGTFRERIPDLHVRTSGLAMGPDGDVWAVAVATQGLASLLINLSSGTFSTLELGGNVAHIDTATGHPLGFVVLSQPDLFLMETSGIVRWRVPLDEVVDGFLSPMDIACGPDGTIAVCAAICEFPDQLMRDEYFALREECLSQGDEEALFGVEDALRSSFATGFVLLLLEADGTVTDAIELGSGPAACAVDDAGRAHLLTQELTGWALSILDPRINEGIPLCLIPYGEPAMVSPHRLASGPDGSLYWDDIIPSADQRWGIARLAPASNVFAFGGSDPGIRWVYEEPLSDSLRLATALACAPNGDLWIGCQDFPWSFETEEPESAAGEAHVVSVLRADSQGNLLRRDPPPAALGSGSPIADLHALAEGVFAIWAGADTDSPCGTISPNGEWTPADQFLPGSPIANARVGEIADGFIGWFVRPSDDFQQTAWFRIGADFNNAWQIDRLGAINCRLLDSDPAANVFYVTIDDGEVFRLDADNLQVTGIWHNRLPSGAPGHPLDDAVWLTDDLAILDREHRAVFSVAPEAFDSPQLARGGEVSDAVTLIRNALSQFRSINGWYPPPSPDLLDDLLTAGERETVRMAFLGGRIYGYEPSETSYQFLAWSAAADQPVLVCDLSSTETVY